MSDYEDLIGPVKVKRKKERVAELTLLGLTQQQIADEIGISQPAVGYHQKDIREEWKKQNAQAYDDHLNQELEHYRTLLAALRSGIEAGSWKHIDTAVKLAERRSKLIGLDHADQMNEARVKIEAAQLDIMTAAFNAALDAAGVTGSQRAIAVETLIGEIEEKSD